MSDLKGWVRASRSDAVVSPYCTECGAEVTGRKRRSLCHRCQDRRYGRDVQCSWCGEVFRCTKTAWGHAQRQGRTTFYCGKSCKARHEAVQRDPYVYACRVWFHRCQDCGTWRVERWDNPWCLSQQCQEARRKAARSREYQRYYADPQHRALMIGRSHQARYEDEVDLVTVLDIAARDGWDCHWCAGPTHPMPLVRYDPEQASIEHLVPVSVGGPHTLANLVIAHLRCNQTRVVTT